MPDSLTIDIAVAISTLVTPAVFLAALAIAGWRRSRGLAVGARFTTLVTVLGGGCLGLFLLMSGGIAVAWPILGAAFFLWIVLVARGSWRLAWWFVAGVAAPWTIVSGLTLARGSPSSDALGIWQPLLAFLVGSVFVLVALASAIVKRAPAMEAAVTAARTRPSGRTFGDVAAAVRAPALIGPFGLSEVALLAALVGTWIVTAVLLPTTLPEPARIGITIALSSVLGAEAYIRAMPAPAREAFEAFSWLGEWELAQIRALTGGGVPTNELAARRWLLAHPEQPETSWLRVEMLTFARKHDDAKATADRMPDSTPAERFDRAAALDFADWYAGGEGDVAAMEDAAIELHPSDGDARLRAEVAIAIARVRHRMAAGDDPIAAGEPLREVRKRLGHRADGQVGRALRLRLIRPLLIVGAFLAVLSLLLPDVAPFP